MEYTVDYFIEKFTAIPDELWTTGKYTGVANHKGNIVDVHCALGHCGVENALSTESTALARLFINTLNYTVVSVNDGYAYNYKQSTPKARILAALHDIKTKQQ